MDYETGGGGDCFYYVMASLLHALTDEAPPLKQDVKVVDTDAMLKLRRIAAESVTYGRMHDMMEKLQLEKTKRRGNEKIGEFNIEFDDIINAALEIFTDYDFDDFEQSDFDLMKKLTVNWAELEDEFKRFKADIKKRTVKLDKKYPGISFQLIPSDELRLFVLRKAIADTHTVCERKREYASQLEVGSIIPIFERDHVVPIIFQEGYGQLECSTPSVDHVNYMKTVPGDTIFILINRIQTGGYLHYKRAGIKPRDGDGETVYSLIRYDPNDHGMQSALKGLMQMYKKSCGMELVVGDIREKDINVNASPVDVDVDVDENSDEEEEDDSDDYENSDDDGIPQPSDEEEEQLQFEIALEESRRNK